MGPFMANVEIIPVVKLKRSVSFSIGYDTVRCCCFSRNPATPRQGCRDFSLQIKSWIIFILHGFQWDFSQQRGVPPAGSSHSTANSPHATPASPRELEKSLARANILAAGGDVEDMKMDEHGSTWQCWPLCFFYETWRGWTRGVNMNDSCQHFLRPRVSCKSIQAPMIETCIYSNSWVANHRPTIKIIKQPGFSRRNTTYRPRTSWKHSKDCIGQPDIRKISVSHLLAKSMASSTCIACREEPLVATSWEIVLDQFWHHQ